MASLSSLPPELLRDIIESTVPPSYHSTTYRERQSTLCSLSRVSRQFRAIAQPLLLEIVSIDTDDQLRSFLEGRSGTFELKEVLVGYYVNSEGSRELLSGSKGLQSLTIERQRQDSFDLAVLVQHTSQSMVLSTGVLNVTLKLSSSAVELVNLQLIGSGFDFTIRGPLTSLRSLTFDYSALDSSIPLLLDPEVLPSLQALGLKFVAYEEVMQQLGETSLSRRLPQLHAIIIHPDPYHLGINGLFSGYASRILLDVNHGSLNSPASIQSLASVQHVRIREFTPFTLKASTSILTLLATCQGLENSSLESIYLPIGWHPSRIESADIMTEMKRVMEEGEKAGIELVFELQPESYLDYYISREFWDRQRRRRKAEEQR
ncbi:uncharacterized protein JCM6883_007452 [Sporobolomyces salmoneus]|uniref:uncharacterized protein n=1 Tax=Sporobolomyces salmoneus TaxID=183962 RepID=UPI00317CB04A